MNDWIQQLAQAELVPEVESGMNPATDPHQLIEESTIEWLRDLRDLFFDYARQLNMHAQNATRFPEIKVYQIAQTAADFMLFRNQVKLTVTNAHHGVIQFSFSRHAGRSMSVDGSIEPMAPESGGLHPLSNQQELVAQMGPFRNIYWTFGGERVSVEEVARFYFAEFARSSRTLKKAKSGNAILLEQIKTLLQEKGLDL